ncbi:Uma2 family endonuclease [Nocardiopsis composta]|uniref:Uma2 family endonuclease n=1 Tax=Nocardiopsis composta TaxID=157465 RepID=A0A7W8VD68_9ACTN|nr:Uma2 family endonuclease [Nocardiopsis composta]MBB5431710.1 Uma2 family endonuclease [Nocardiopsis composta]
MSVTAPERRRSSEAVFGPAEDSSLRVAAQKTAELLPDGYRVEILGGNIVVSPTPTNKHNGVIRRVLLQLENQLPESRITLQTTSVGWAGEDDDIVIPDLVILPVEAEDDDVWLNSPDVIDFALEVVSRGNSMIDTKIKPGVYAGMAIPVYLILDPRDGAITCYSDPRGGTYRSVHHWKFGDTVVLPAPLKDVEIETGGLPRYGG